MNFETVDNINNKEKRKHNFDPSAKTLSRILKSILDKGPEVKNRLSANTKINYTRLAKHIVWMETKGLVKSTIVQSHIKINLTEKGRIFASVILDK